MSNVNDTGVIPDLYEINGIDDNGPGYLKHTCLMMGIFQGVGIIESLLKKHTKHKRLYISFEGHTARDSSYSGIYLTDMDAFRNSSKVYVNAGDDVQKFISFRDMKKIR